MVCLYSIIVILQFKIQASSCNVAFCIERLGWKRRSAAEHDTLYQGLNSNCINYHSFSCCHYVFSVISVYFCDSLSWAEWCVMTCDTVVLMFSHHWHSCIHVITYQWYMMTTDIQHRLLKSHLYLVQLWLYCLMIDLIKDTSLPCLENDYLNKTSV